MAKRFIDTGLFDDEWFAELNPECKMFWIYYLTKCDHAGLLKYNKKLIEFQTGIKSLDTVIEQLGNRLVRVNEQLFFCPKFIMYQYPGFPNCKFKAALSAINLLINNGLFDSETRLFKELPNSYLTVSKELPNSYCISNGNGIKIHNGDCFKNSEEAFTAVRDDEEFVNSLVRIARGSGYVTITDIQVMKAVRHFILTEGAKPDFDYRPRDEIKKHLINWISKNAKKLTQYG